MRKHTNQKSDTTKFSIIIYFISILTLTWLITLPLKNKAVGYDLITEELCKDEKINKEQKLRFDWHFRFFNLRVIFNYFMNAKLILVIKNNQKYIEINNIKPVSVFPTKAKVFETTILHNLERLT